jgi:type VI secretion system protein ImpL
MDTTPPWKFLIMRKLLTSLYVISFVSVILLSLLGAVLFKEIRTPLIVTAISLFSIFCIIFFFKKTLIRKKVKSFINRVITQDRETISKAPPSTQTELLALEKSWFESVTKLKQSALRAYGNPLYVLPWYLVIGESGTGKTSLLKSSGLSSSLSSLNSTPRLPITRNCDWWFFNEAIVLDTAGRYTIPLDQDRDDQEWEVFLKHLSSFRKKEPVNGIVAAISAETLTMCSSEQLLSQGQLVRSRIDQVMRILGSSFPIYIMITKMDLIFGMPEFFRALPRSRLGQAMGWCNSSGQPYSEDLLKKAILSVCDNLKLMQFSMLHNARKPEAEILVFPQRFLELSEQLATFCTSVFSQSVYHVTPFFRGVYFSSASQKIEQAECDDSTQEISTEALCGGLFLKEFFSRVLPGDRKFHWRIPQYRLQRSLFHKVIFG